MQTHNSIQPPKLAKIEAALPKTQTLEATPSNSVPSATEVGHKPARWQRRARMVGTLVIIFLAGFSGVAVFLDNYGKREGAQPAQAIIVLGARVTEKGVPGDALTRRTLQAALLYHKGLAPKIICTGGVGTYPPAEAKAAAQLAIRYGVPVGNLLLEDKSTSTWENATNAVRICKEQGWTRVIVVSDRYHLWRARRDFQRQGLTVYPSPSRIGSWWPRIRGTAREVMVVMRDLLIGLRSG